MLLIRTHQRASFSSADDATPNHSGPPTSQAEPPVVPTISTLEHTVRTWHNEGRSQRSIARDLNIDRRKVKQIIDCNAA
jgi:hypothetical protein